MNREVRNIMCCVMKNRATIHHTPQKCLFVFLQPNHLIFNNKTTNQFVFLQTVKCLNRGETI